MLILEMIAEHCDHVEVCTCYQRSIVTWKGVYNAYFDHIHGALR